MFSRFTQPVSLAALLPDEELRVNQLGKHVHFNDKNGFDLAHFDVAIVGVKDGRGSMQNQGCSEAPDAVRKQLYRLFTPKVYKPLRIVDLGNIPAGNEPKDTRSALRGVVLELLNNNIVPIIIGGGHDLTFGQYLGYQELYKLINMVIVDERIDMNETKENLIEADCFLMPLLTYNPNYLFNYSHLGYQVYLNDPATVDTLESLNFDCHRLGMLRGNLEEVEPILRDADMLSIDISSIRQADAPAHANATPNGFSGEELCQITRYAGLSDKLTSIGFYELNPSFDKGEQSAQLVAQMVWYFLQGFYSRKGDFPIHIDDFLKFTVKFEEFDHELIFWKSKATDRWWMELPFGDKKKYGRHQMVPCSYSDYELACKEELPDRWMKVYNKLV